MQAFYTGHLFACLGDFYAVAWQYGFSIEPYQVRMVHEYSGGPQLRKHLYIQCAAVKEVQDPVITGGRESQCAHHAGDAPQVLPDGKPD